MLYHSHKKWSEVRRQAYLLLDLLLNHYNYFLHTYIVVLSILLFTYILVVKTRNYTIIVCAINSVILMVSSTAHV